MLSAADLIGRDDQNDFMPPQLVRYYDDDDDSVAAAVLGAAIRHEVSKFDDAFHAAINDGKTSLSTGGTPVEWERCLKFHEGVLGDVPGKSWTLELAETTPIPPDRSAEFQEDVVRIALALMESADNPRLNWVAKFSQAYAEKKKEYQRLSDAEKMAYDLAADDGKCIRLGKTDGAGNLINGGHADGLVCSFQPRAENGCRSIGLIFYWGHAALFEEFCGIGEDQTTEEEQFMVEREERRLAERLVAPALPLSTVLPQSADVAGLAAAPAAAAAAAPAAAAPAAATDPVSIAVQAFRVWPPTEDDIAKFARAIKPYKNAPGELLDENDPKARTNNVARTNFFAAWRPHLKNGGVVARIVEVAIARMWNKLSTDEEEEWRQNVREVVRRRATGANKGPAPRPFTAAARRILIDAMTENVRTDVNRNGQLARLIGDENTKLNRKRVKNFFDKNIQHEKEIERRIMEAVNARGVRIKNHDWQPRPARNQPEELVKYNDACAVARNFFNVPEVNLTKEAMQILAQHLLYNSSYLDGSDSVVAKNIRLAAVKICRYAREQLADHADVIMDPPKDKDKPEAIKKKKRDRDGASNDAGGPSKKATSSEAASSSAPAASSSAAAAAPAAAAPAAASSLAITASDFAAGFFAAVP